MKDVRSGVTVIFQNSQLYILSVLSPPKVAADRIQWKQLQIVSMHFNALSLYQFLKFITFRSNTDRNTFDSQWIRPIQNTQSRRIGHWFFIHFEYNPVLIWFVFVIFWVISCVCSWFQQILWMTDILTFILILISSPFCRLQLTITTLFGSFSIKKDSRSLCSHRFL